MSELHSFFAGSGAFANLVQRCSQVFTVLPSVTNAGEFLFLLSRQCPANLEEFLNEHFSLFFVDPSLVRADVPSTADFDDDTTTVVTTATNYWYSLSENPEATFELVAALYNRHRCEEAGYPSQSSFAIWPSGQDSL